MSEKLGIKFGGHIGLSKYDIRNAVKDGKLVGDLMNLENDEILKLVTRDVLWEIDIKDSSKVGELWLRGVLSSKLNKSIFRYVQYDDDPLVILIVYKYAFEVVYNNLKGVVDSDGFLTLDKLKRGLVESVDFLMDFYKNVKHYKVLLGKYIDAIDYYDEDLKDKLNCSLVTLKKESVINVVLALGYDRLFQLYGYVARHGVDGINVLLGCIQDLMKDLDIGYSSKFDLRVLIKNTNINDSTIYLGNLSTKRITIKELFDDTRIKGLKSIIDFKGDDIAYTLLKEALARTVLGIDLNSGDKLSTNKGSTKGREAMLDVVKFGDSTLDELKGTYNYKGNISTDKLLNDFGLYGGEFGSWNSQKERQYCLDLSYNAFKDLGYVLQLDNSLVGLPNINKENRALAIAFGARGKGSYKAHYESGLNVINLTKLKGAGSLAHEWGHALDRWLSLNLEGKSTNLFTGLRVNKDAKGYELSELWSLVYQEYISSDGKDLVDYNKQVEDGLARISNLGVPSNLVELLKHGFGIQNKNKDECMRYYRTIWVPSYKRITQDALGVLDKVTEIYSDLVGTLDLENRKYFGYSSCYRLAVRSGKSRYYLSNVEVFARLFNRYVYERLKSLGHTNNYLCGLTGLEPTDEEWARVSVLFNEYMEKVLDILRGVSGKRVNTAEVSKDVKSSKGIMSVKDLRGNLKVRYAGIISSKDLLDLYTSYLSSKGIKYNKSDIDNIVLKVAEIVSSNRYIQEGVVYVSFKLLGLDRRKYILSDDWNVIISDKSKLDTFLKVLDNVFNKFLEVHKNTHS